jgi:hypothetical protein
MSAMLVTRTPRRGRRRQGAWLRLPVPALRSSFSLQESALPAGDEGYLGIAVGPAELVFSIPISAFDELGRTLLAISAEPGRYRT